MQKWQKVHEKTYKKWQKFVSTLFGRHNLLLHSFIWLKIKREGKELKYLIEKTFVI